ncbi:MAG TPA: UDP-N-acetylglucosamine 1-carboxyvinyltransferase [Clostridiales bacterium]|nr:UDP-N-acetylglucosamine 1-carboxyvinyltransferase [Clostridiales bacterium]
MAELIIEGCRRLDGSIKVQGAKNSALPILAATILCKDQSVLHNCPCLSDVDVSIKILRYLGCMVNRDGDTLLVDSDTVNNSEIPQNLMREMRSSIIFLGAILSRVNKAKLSFPGGCELGPRPIDLHLKALAQMGVAIEENHGVLECHAPDGLHGAKIALSFPSVGATENIMLAAVCAKGTTVITNVAREPEISDLADFLNACGGRVSGAGESTIFIDGVDTLTGAQHCIIPDRIVAATYISAVAISGGRLFLKQIIPSHLGGVISVFEDAGCSFDFKPDGVMVYAPYRLLPVKLIRTMPYPGFPTDAQAPVMAMCTKARGTTIFVENIFESRYKHVDELSRLGAKINVQGKVAIVEGVKRLSGACVEAQDLRGGAGLVVAGLGAEGTTHINGLKYIERGYEDIDVYLSSIGANIKKL